MVIKSSFFGWPTAATRRLCRDWRVDEGLGADVLGHEIGMLAQAVAGSFDLDDDSVVQESIEQSGGDHGIAEYLAPFGKAAIGREDHGAAFVSGIDELEEQIAAAGDDRQVPDLIDDQQRGPAQERSGTGSEYARVIGPPVRPWRGY